MAKKKLNLGTLRDSDDVLQPPELPTTYPARTRPLAPWAELIDSTEGVKETMTLEHFRIGGSNFSDTPDTLEIPSEIPHTRVKLTTQAKKAAREFYGGGQGGSRKDVED